MLRYRCNISLITSWGILLDQFEYKDRAVSVICSVHNIIGFIWILLIDGAFVGPEDDEKPGFPTPTEACEDGAAYARAYIDELAS